MRCIGKDDEELGVRTVRIGRTGHGNGAANVTFVGKFGIKFLAGTTGSIAFGITGLRHETFDHTMEFQPIVKAFTGEFLDPGNMFRCQIRAKLDHNAAIFQVKIKRVFQILSDSVVSIGHGDKS